jgi:AcrR family transcriptional regulator
MAQAATEERIAKGARRAIERYGWQGATMARIAEEAGVSRMTLHRRGVGREEIVSMLAREYAESFLAALAPAVTGRGRGFARLERALAAICAVTEEHLGFLRGLDEETDTRLFHERAREVRSRDPFVASLERLLEDGIRDGSVRPVRVTETATTLVNAVDRTYRHLRTAHGWSPTRARKALLDVCLRGLAP